MKKLILSLLMVMPLVAKTASPALTVNDVVSHPDTTKLIDKRINKKRQKPLYTIGIAAASGAVTSVLCTIVMKKILE